MRFVTDLMILMFLLLFYTLEVMVILFKDILNSGKKYVFFGKKLNSKDEV